MGSHTMQSQRKPTILDLILQAGPKGIGTHAIVDALYGHREDGGPDDPDNTVAARVNQLRKAGHPIETVRVYRYGRARLKA